MTDWTEKTAAELGRAIAALEVDPVDLVQAYYDKIAAHPFADRIYARLTPERALAEASAASDRARAGQRLSPLDGVPVSWKDLYDTAGIVTEAGSALLQGRVPDEDALVLQNATAMGTVCLGKTHMSELAFSGLGLNPVTATSPCVNDHDAVAGGSSSGAATSVAFGLAAASVGSDTGGSVRIPSVWNDLVGLKTTSGRISLRGVVPLCEKFDTVGPLVRTVEDAALMLAVIEGGTPIDTRNPAPLKGMRFGALQTVVLDDLRDVPASAHAATLDKLADAGAEIIPFDFPEIEGAMADAGILYTTEAYAIWRDAIEAQPDLMFAPIRDRFRAGAQFNGADYVAAWRRLNAMRANWAKATAGVDAVICPTSPMLAPNVDRLLSDPDYFVAENLLALRNTRVGNLTGGAIVTLPNGTPSCGLSLMGRPMGEEEILRIALSVESALT